MRINGQVIKWKKLGKGGFNQTYVSVDEFPYQINGMTYHQRWVLKQPQKLKDDELALKMNDSHRAVRIWNELNPDYPAIELPEENGWMAPFFGGDPASDIEISTKLIEIYKTHRRIISDACGYKNFLLYQGEARCIDVDVATHLNSPVSKRVLKEVVALGESGSAYEYYWQTFSINYNMPKSVQMIKTLLYLESEVPEKDILDCHLNERTLELLHEYRLKNKPINKNILDTLLISNAKKPDHSQSGFMQSGIRFFSLIGASLSASDSEINTHESSMIQKTYL